MAELPAVTLYQARVAQREQRVNSLTAQLDKQNQELSDKQSNLSQSIKNINFRRGPTARPTIQKVNQLTRDVEATRLGFEAFQSDAQRQIDQENADVEVAYQAAVDESNSVGAQRQRVLESYQESFSPRQAERYKDLYFAEQELSNLIASGANPQRIIEQKKSINGIKQDISRTDRSPSGFKAKKEISVTDRGGPLIINGEAVVYQYTNASNNKQVFVTTSGKEYFKDSAGATSQTVTTQAPVKIKDLISLRRALNTNVVSGGIENAFFTETNNPPTQVQSFASTQRLKNISSQPMVDTNLVPAIIREPLADIGKRIIKGYGIVEPELRKRFEAGRSIVQQNTIFGSPEVRRGADIVGQSIKPVVDPVLKLSEDVSEFSFKVGADIGRGASDAGRFISKTTYDFTSPGNLGENLPTPGIRTGSDGVPQIVFVSPKDRPKEYNPYISEKDFKVLREQGAIALGTTVSLIPYVAGGSLSVVQRAADVGSALKEDPKKAVILFGTGVASTVLFNEIGSVGRVIRGQLGGTITGSVGFAKNFEDASRIGGKAFGIALFAPYVAQEALGIDIFNPTAPPRTPNLYSSFIEGDTEAFRKGFTTLQETSGVLYLGSRVGQKLSTGFTLFPGPNAITSGGLTAPTEALARKRFIANIFNASYVEPMLSSSQQSFVKKSVGEGATVKQLKDGVVKISFDAKEITDSAGQTLRLPAKTVTVKPPKTPFQIKQFYEKMGVTKQSFLESYDITFSSLKGVSVPVKEFDPSKVKAISNNKKAQEVLLKYFQENKGEFIIYGGGSQGPQLGKVKIRLSGDIDVLALNPKKFEAGLLQKFRQAGFSERDFRDYVSPKMKLGEVSIAAGPSGRKFVNIHDISKDKFLFSQLQTVGDVVPRKVFVKTPSGINITELRFQAERKIVGGFVDLRAKDIRDVFTITKSLKRGAEELGINLPKENTIFSSAAISGGINTGAFGEFQLISGVKPPGPSYVKEFRALESQVKGLKGVIPAASRLDISLVKGIKGDKKSQEALVEFYRVFGKRVVTGGSTVTGSNISSRLSKQPADLDVYLLRGDRAEIRSGFRRIIRETGSSLFEKRGRFYQPGVKKPVLDFPDYQKAVTNIKSTLDFGETVSSRIQTVQVFSKPSFKGKGGGEITDPVQSFLVKQIVAKKGYIGGSGALTVGVKGFRQPEDIEGYFKNTTLAKLESLSKGFSEKLSAKFGGKYTSETFQGKVRIINPKGKIISDILSKPSTDTVVRVGNVSIRSPELVFIDKQNIVRYGVLKNYLGKSVQKSVLDIASVRSLTQPSTGIQTNVISPYTLALRSVYGAFQTAKGKTIYRYSRDVPRLIQSVSDFAITEKAIPSSNVPILKQLNTYRASRFLDFVKTNYSEALTRSQFSPVPNRPVNQSLFKPGFLSTFSSTSGQKGFVSIDAFKLGPSRREVRLQKALGEKYIPPAVTAREYGEIIAKGNSSGFGKRSFQQDQRYFDSAIPSKPGTDTRFGLTVRGAIETNLGLYPKGEKVRNILHLGEQSGVIKDYSTITGLRPAVLVKKIGNLEIQVLSGKDKAGKLLPKDLISGFGIDTDTKGTDKLFGKTGTVGVAVRRFQGIFQTEYQLSHELTHGAEYVVGRPQNTSNLSPADYLQSGSEVRARSVQARFKLSKGKQFTLNDIFEGINPSAEVKPLNQYSDFSSKTKIKTSPKSFDVSDAESLYAQAYRKNVKLPSPKSVIFGNKSGSPKSSRADDYSYYIPTAKSYPTYFPVLPKEQIVYTPPSKKYEKPYVPPPTKYYTAYVPPPYVPPPEIYVPPYEPPPYSPLYVPPPYVPPPYVPPPYVPPPYVPPYTPPYVAPPYVPPPYVAQPFFTRPPEQPRKEDKKKGKKPITPDFKGFDVFVQQNIGGRKQFIEVDGKGTSLLESDAEKFGQNVTDRSLEASYYIKPSKSPVAELRGLPNLSYKFRISKQRIRKTIPVKVEIESYRLDTPSEVKKIHAFKVAAQLRKNIIKRKQPSRRNANFAFNVI